MNTTVSSSVVLPKFSLLVVTGFPFFDNLASVKIFCSRHFVWKLFRSSSTETSGIVLLNKNTQLNNDIM